MRASAGADAEGGAGGTARTALYRRSRGGSRQDLKAADAEEQDPLPPRRDAGDGANGANSDDDSDGPSPRPPPPAPSSSPPLLSTSRRPLSLLLVALALLGLASVAVVGGLQMVARARAARSGVSDSAAATTAAATAVSAAVAAAAASASAKHHPHHITVAIADLHGDWPHAVVALRASGVISDQGARSLPTPAEAERDWRLPSRHSLSLEATELFDLSQLQSSEKGVPGTLHLVQTGDLVDRGRHGLALVRLFGALRDVARRGSKGGGGEEGGSETTTTPDQQQQQQPRATVELLLGNHELLNLQGDAARYAHTAELRAVAAAEKKKEEEGTRAWARLMAPGGDLGDALRGDRAIAHVAGRGPCRTLFVHAGLTPGLLGDLVARAEKAAKGGGGGNSGGNGGGNDDANSNDAPSHMEKQPSSVIAINRAAAAALSECSGSEEGEGGCPRDIGARHALGPLLLSGQGPVWTRALAPDGRGGAYRSNNQLALVCAAVDDVLRRVGEAAEAAEDKGSGGGDDDAATGPPRRLVVGHTITRTDGSPTIACGGRLVFLDVGMSRAMWRDDDDDEDDKEDASPPFAGPSPALALRCEFGGPGAKPGAAELVFARPKSGHERDDPRTAPLDVRRMPLPALGVVPAQGVAAAAAAGRAATAAG